VRCDKNLSDSAPVGRALCEKCLSFGKWGNNTAIARPVYYVPLAKSHRASHWLSLTTGKSIARSRQVSWKQSISYPGHGIILVIRERRGEREGNGANRSTIHASSFFFTAHMCVSAHVNSPASSRRPPSRKQENVVQKLLCRVSPAYTISPTPHHRILSILFPLHYLTSVTYTILWAAYLDGIHGGNVIRSCLCAQRYFLRRWTRTLDQSQFILCNVHRTPR